MRGDAVLSKKIKREDNKTKLLFFSLDVIDNLEKSIKSMQIVSDLIREQNIIECNIDDDIVNQKKLQKKYKKIYDECRLSPE